MKIMNFGREKMFKNLKSLVSYAYDLYVTGINSKNPTGDECHTCHNGYVRKNRKRRVGEITPTLFF